MKNYDNFIYEKYEEIKSKHDLIDLLKTAINQSNLDLIELIIDLDVELDDSMITYLNFWNAPKKSLKILKLLTDNGVDINHIFYVNGFTGNVTVSHMIAMNENKNINDFITLYEMGADFFIPSSKGKIVWYDYFTDDEKNTLLAKFPELKIQVEANKFNI